MLFHNNNYKCGKDRQSIEEEAKDLNRPFITEALQMASKHEEVFNFIGNKGNANSPQ